MQLVTNVLQEKKVFMDKSYIFLKPPIGSGGEANIYTVQINSELVAKVYHQPHGDYARKLAFMVANPPVDPLAKEGRVSIAWATELVTDLGLVVGFLMPKLDTSKAKPIFQYYNPSERRKESPTFSYVSLMRTARNLARAVRSVHSRGYVIGDVNESNVLVAEDAIVTLVDTDSFQVNDGTTVYRCTVGKPEYTPPELQGVSFRDVDRSVEHDLFGLGVLIYQLLMEGTHPFGGVFRGQGEAPELKERIKAGHFPHGRRGVPYKPMPLAPSFQMLPVALQELFLLCFEQGHGNPAARPTADVWSKALGVAEDGLVRCGVNGPVVPDLYESLYGQFMIVDVKGNPNVFTDIERDTIDSVLKYYGDKSSQWLTDLVRNEEPWLNARRGVAIGERGDRVISLAAIAEYYGSLQ